MIDHSPPAARTLVALIIAVAAIGVILQYRVTSALPDLSAAMRPGGGWQVISPS